MQVAAFAGVTLDLGDFPSRHPYGLALWQKHTERILGAWASEIGVGAAVAAGVAVSTAAAVSALVSALLQPTSRTEHQSNAECRNLTPCQRELRCRTIGRRTYHLPNPSARTRTPAVSLKPSRAV
jgi:hypothetical protein